MKGSSDVGFDESRIRGIRTRVVLDSKLLKDGSFGMTIAKLTKNHEGGRVLDLGKRARNPKFRRGKWRFDISSHMHVARYGGPFDKIIISCYAGMARTGQ